MAIFDDKTTGKKWTIPDDGEVFTMSDSPQGILWKRVGNNFIRIDDATLRQMLGLPDTYRLGKPEFEQALREQFNIDLGKAKSYSSGELEGTWRWLEGVGGGTSTANPSQFTPSVTQKNEVVTREIHPENPLGTIIKSSTQGELQRDRSVGELEAAFQPQRDLGGLQQGIQSAADLARRLSEERGIALTPEFLQQFGAGQPQGDRGATGQLEGSGAISTGVSQFDELYNVLNQYLTELQKRGQVINPNVDLTPDKIAEFTRQAQAEIDPYYTGQLKLAREELLKSVGYSTDQILRTEQQLEQKYKGQVRQIGEEAAERGFAQSGGRIQEERQLAEQTQQEIDERRRQLQFQVGGVQREFAQQFGTSQTPSFSLGGRPQVEAGGGFSRGGEQPLYELSPETYQGLVGQQEFLQRGQVKSRASELEEAFRTQQGLNQQRYLNL